MAEAGEEEPQIIVDLRDRSHRGPGILADALLLDAYCRRKPFDVVHVGLIHQLEELPRIGREGFHIPPLPFCVNGVKGEGRLSRAARPCDDGYLVPWQPYVDVLEVVLPCALYIDVFHGQSRLSWGFALLFGCFALPSSTSLMRDGSSFPGFRDWHGKRVGDQGA